MAQAEAAFQRGYTRGGSVSPVWKYHACRTLSCLYIKACYALTDLQTNVLHKRLSVHPRKAAQEVA
jgi:uncharacterized membrane protein YhdT